jgi:hypothetical protein
MNVEDKRYRTKEQSTVLAYNEVRLKVRLKCVQIKH